MLRIFDKKSAYSNFWGGVDDQVQYCFFFFCFFFGVIFMVPTQKRSYIYSNKEHWLILYWEIANPFLVIVTIS